MLQVFLRNSNFQEAEYNQINNFSQSVFYFMSVAI